MGNNLPKIAFFFENLKVELKKMAHAENFRGERCVVELAKATHPAGAYILLEDLQNLCKFDS
ncbi:MAG: hypothetical protein LBO71_05695 [Prevotellaceae bacterium]|nr:hypothetical protein [Prevotellaceae bacterium]